MATQVGRRGISVRSLTGIPAIDVLWGTLSVPWIGSVACAARRVTMRKPYSATQPLSVSEPQQQMSVSDSV